MAVGPSNPAAISYRIAAPPETHWRPATCREVGCENWREGWTSLVDVSGPTGRELADLVRWRYRGIPFTETRDGDTSIRFGFPPGAPCFEAARHYVRLDRDFLYLVGRYGQVTQHQPAEFVEQWAETLDIAAALATG